MTIQANDDGNTAPPKQGPSIGEVMTVAGGLGAGYGAAQVIGMSGGTAGLTASTWIPVMAAGAGGVAAAGLAGYGIGQVLNGADWFKSVINTAIDNLIIGNNSMPNGELPKNFHLYTPNNDGSMPWTIKALEAIKADIQNFDYDDVYFSSPYDGAGFAGIFSNPFDSIESAISGAGSKSISLEMSIYLC